MHFQSHQNYSTEEEAMVNHLVNPHLWASYTYLSLGFYFSSDDMWLSSVWSTSWSWMRNTSTPKHLLKCKTSAVDTPSSRTSRRFSNLCDFLEKNHFLGEKVKLIKQMADHLQAGQPPGWARY
ncbi:ferritin light chain-like [Saccopteryx bilineata]|uniref:ferritin light chain-like n=1 Tax=Saccopteryx bilineata TaxID=59482 RepID=UPI00338F335F